MSASKRDNARGDGKAGRGAREDSGGRPAAAADRCPDCGGRGGVLLLVSTVPCLRCGGTGHLAPATPTDSAGPGVAPAPVTWVAEAEAGASEYTRYALPAWPDAPAPEEPGPWTIAWG